MEVNFNVTTNAAPAVGQVLEIYFDQLNNPGVSQSPLFQMDLDGTSSLGTVKYDAGLCNANMANFMVATLMLQSAQFGPGSFDRTWLQTANANLTGGYSLTQRVQISASGAGATFHGLAELQAVPEPATLLLLGTGLAGLARWRKRRG
jgi:hypothetical protein